MMMLTPTSLALHRMTSTHIGLIGEGEVYRHDEVGLIHRSPEDGLAMTTRRTANVGLVSRSRLTARASTDSQKPRNPKFKAGELVFGCAQFK